MSKVSLVSHSIPVDELGINNSEELVAFCARVSNPQNQLNTATADKLLAYLITHKHWSPFEMVSVCMEINTTRDISRQILRHRSFTFQEFSQRYADARYLNHCTKDTRLQDPDNRQNSIICKDAELIHWWQEAQEHVWDVAEDIYAQALRRGLAKEVARAVLPEGMTLSRLYMMGSLRSWIHYIEVRTGEETQLEHQQLAWEVLSVLGTVFPVIQEHIMKERGISLG